MSRFLFACFLFSVSGPLAAQTEAAPLEERLQLATGRERFDLLLRLTIEAEEMGDDKVIAWGEEALSLLPSGIEPDAEAELRTALREAYFRRRDYERAIEQGDRVVQGYRQSRDRAGLADSLNRVSDLYRAKGSYRRSLEVALEALPFYLGIEDPQGLGNLLGNIGTCHRRLGNYSQALDFYFRAYEQYQALDHRTGVARSLNQIGIVYRHLGQLDKSLETYRDALAIFESEGDLRGVGSVSNNIGNLYRLQGNSSLALESYSRAFEINQRLGNRSGLATQFHNMGFAHQTLGNLDQAMRLYRQALELRQELEDQRGIANTLQHIATAHHDLGQFEKAVEMFEASLATALAIQSQDEIQDAYRDLARTLTAMGRHREALEALRAYDRARRETFNEQSHRTIAEVQTRFDLARKEAEIELLKQQQALAELESRQQRASREALAGIVLLLLFVILLATNRYRLQVRYNRAIENQNRDLARSLSELRDSERRYRRLFDDPSLAKLLLDPADGVVLAANDSASRLLQASSEAEGAGTGWLPILQQEVAKVRDGDEQRSLVASLTLGKEDRHFEAWASRLRLDGADVFLITLQDVTERRRLEEENLRRASREQYISELEAQQAEIEAHNVEKERFAYTVSHDLKTPLVTIRGFLGVIEQDAAAGDLEQVHQNIERIDSAARRMGRLLQELLELSRIGRITRPSVGVNLGELARQAVDLLRLGTGAPSVTISEDLSEAAGDPSRLMDVFRHLIDNAIKFMGDQKTPRIEVGSQRRGEDTVFYVRDNGIGIDRAYQGKVFGLFEQLDPRVPGTGMGLALVEKIVELHGGRIWVESEGSGRGSTFFFTLGRLPADSAALASWF